MPLSAATLKRLQNAQKSGMYNALEHARAIRQVDIEAGQVSARELRMILLEQHGIDLREDKINRGRYIARLLHALDPVGLDPLELKHITDAETLYLLQRLHELTQTPLGTLLTTLNFTLDTQTYVQVRQRLKDAIARAENRTRKDKSTWRQPLMRLEGPLCDRIDQAFSAYARNIGSTQYQAAESLADLLSREAALPAELTTRLHLVLTLFSRSLGVAPADGIAFVCDLLESVPAEHWRSLHTTVNAT